MGRSRCSFRISDGTLNNKVLPPCYYSPMFEFHYFASHPTVVCICCPAPWPACHSNPSLVSLSAAAAPCITRPHTDPGRHHGRPAAVVAVARLRPGPRGPRLLRTHQGPLQLVRSAGAGIMFFCHGRCPASDSCCVFSLLDHVQYVQVLLGVSSC